MTPQRSSSSATAVRDGVGAAVATQVFIPGSEGGQVGDVLEDPPGIVHQLGFVHFADHDGVVDTQPGEDAAPTANAEEADLPERGAEGGELDVVLVAQAQAVDRVAGGAEGAGDKQWEATPAGDEADSGGGCGRVREDRQR